MSIDDIITLALNYQDKFNSTLVNINKDIGELKFDKLRPKLAVSKSVNSNLWKKISGITENIENKDLENLTLQTFEKIDINVDPVNVEDCH